VFSIKIALLGLPLTSTREWLSSDIARSVLSLLKKYPHPSSLSITSSSTSDLFLLHGYMNLTICYNKQKEHRNKFNFLALLYLFSPCLCLILWAKNIVMPGNSSPLFCFRSMPPCPEESKWAQQSFQLSC